MNKHSTIGIGICTYDRPAGLSDLLGALDRQSLDRVADEYVSIIVVDNSSASTARLVCDNYSKSGRFSLIYISETAKGLATARNKVLAAGHAEGVELLAFIDDDEYPLSAWLSGLIHAIKNSDMDCIIGPVWPVFEVYPKEWAVYGGFYAKHLTTRSGLVNDGYTSNAIIDLARTRDSGVLFDPEYNATGGEDTLFFHNLIKAQYKIGFADGAEVYELIPKKRMNLSWLLSRWYRTGMTESRLLTKSRSLTIGRWYNFGRGILRLFAGVLLFPYRIFSERRLKVCAIKSMYTMARGTGLIASVLGISYQEYAKKFYR